MPKPYPRHEESTFDDRIMQGGAYRETRGSRNFRGSDRAALLRFRGSGYAAEVLQSERFDRVSWSGVRIELLASGEIRSPGVAQNR